VANLTASRVSTERVRKLRLFQPHEYLSLDYARQDLFSLAVTGGAEIASKPVLVEKDEPLRLELESFFECVETRSEPRVGGEDAYRALDVALAIAARIQAHSEVVAQTLAARGR
jgi:predicted dehydrogenase